MPVEVGAALRASLAAGEDRHEFQEVQSKPEGRCVALSRILRIGLTMEIFSLFCTCGSLELEALPLGWWVLEEDGGMLSEGCGWLLCSVVALC